MAAEPEYEPGLESRVEPRIERVDPKVDPEFRDQAELPHELRNDIEMLNDRKRMPSHEVSLFNPCVRILFLTFTCRSVGKSCNELQTI